MTTSPTFAEGLRAATILIVEDDTELAAGLAIRLRAEGYDVITASGVQTGIRFAHATVPDLVILDIGLPDGTGLDVMEAMKASPELEDIPVVVLTARNRSIAERFARAGADLVFRKPAETALMLRAIQHRIAEARD